MGLKTLTNKIVAEQQVGGLGATQGPRAGVGLPGPQEVGKEAQGPSGSPSSSFFSFLSSLALSGGSPVHKLPVQ